MLLLLSLLTYKLLTLSLHKIFSVPGLSVYAQMANRDLKSKG